MAKAKRKNKTTGRIVNSEISTVGPDGGGGGGSDSKANSRESKKIENTDAAKVFDFKAYKKLLTEALPRIIDSQEEYDRIEANFENLLDKGESRTLEEDSLFDLLTNLLEDYEKRTLPPLEPTSPISKLKFLMEQNDLNQSDMIEYFGSQGNVSQVLAGKRAISKGAARKLSERFKVSTDIFLKDM